MKIFQACTKRPRFASPSSDGRNTEFLCLSPFLSYLSRRSEIGWREIFIPSRPPRFSIIPFPPPPPHPLTNGTSGSGGKRTGIRCPFPENILEFAVRYDNLSLRERIILFSILPFRPIAARRNNYRYRPIFDHFAMHCYFSRSVSTNLNRIN